MDALLARCASLEQNSEHPIARAFLQKAAEEKLTLSPIEDFQSFPGRAAWPGLSRAARFA